MRKINVLIVDDSVVMRRLLTEVLSADPDISVVGAAANGRIALAKLPQLTPDVVTLDVEMPEMDGLETLAGIRRTHPHLPVIMFSSATERGAETTLQALTLGAMDYVTKPSGPGSIEGSLQHIRAQLIPKIKALGSAAAGRRPGVSVLPAALPAPTIARPWAPTVTNRVEVLAIGTSTGGPNALSLVLESIGSDFPVPIVIVQHMPPLFTKMLAERLTKVSKLQVHEAEAGQVLEPGHAWIAPGDHHMVLRRDGARVRVAINREPPENSCRPAVDVLFRSVVEVFGGGTLAVIMTGMGQDGLRGCERVRAAGGQIVVQDEATSVVWGMPGFVARAGLADAVRPLEGISDEIWRRVGRVRRSSPTTGVASSPT